jgi:Domain of unknown function (DUF4397)
VVRISAICILSVMLSSCLKNNNSNIPVTPAALVSIVQASPGQPVLDFSLDANRVNLNPLKYNDGLDYFRATIGKRTLLFSNDASGTAIATDTITLRQNVAYSVFLVNTVSSPQIFHLTDSLTAPTTGNANLRFINLSPDAPAVDLAIKGGAVIVANKAFKGFSSFQPIAGMRYSFEIRKAGTTTVLATMDNVTINNGFIYTIYLHGLAAATDATKLTGDLITNAAPY